LARKPVLLWITASMIPPELYPTTGTPWLIASMGERPKCSPTRVWQNTLAHRYRLRSSSSEGFIRNSMSSHFGMSLFLQNIWYVFYQ
jgi:hypothetical protein